MMCGNPEFGHRHGRCGLAAGTWPSKVEAAFRENEIDETVLSSLTHETLEELGVTAVGHRLKLLDSIAALRSNTTSPAPSADPTTMPEAPNVSPEGRAERGQVTMMFSDLVGSTALSARMDPEDLREVISAYQKCVAETVGRYGGFVAKYMGDGVLVYFGYPQAHEDDAERAVSHAAPPQGERDATLWWARELGFTWQEYFSINTALCSARWCVGRP